MRSPSPLPSLFPALQQAAARPTTPPLRPCTPPRKRTVSGNTIRLSPQRTPISHRGLHMSPSPSLAHYKSHLDPPPAAVFHPQAPLLTGHLSAEDVALTLPTPETLLRTPSRKRATPTKGQGRSDVNPFTPKHHFAPGTPSRISDPYDPAGLIEEEVFRLGTQDSPSGLFGKHSVFYESPGIPSPSRWDRIW